MLPFDVAGFCAETDRMLEDLRSGRTPKTFLVDWLQALAPVAFIAIGALLMLLSRAGWM